MLGRAGGVFNAAPGTLEHFLTERYCLYALDERHRILSAGIHHAPWPLLHLARRQDVVIWPLRRAGDPATRRGT